MSFRNTKDSHGYVSLEFALAIGLLILPTILILLQVPILLEKNNRLESIAALIANDCANNASSINNANNLAKSSVETEIRSTTSLKNSHLVSATCNFENNKINHGTNVTSKIVLSTPAPVVPGASFGIRWNITSEHIAMVPKYRSLNE